MRAGEEHVDAVALALGQLDGQERSAAAEHVLSCGDCRHEFDEVNSIVGELLPAVPAVQPKLGFDVEVLQRLGIDTAPPRRRPTMVGPRDRRGRRRRGRVGGRRVVPRAVGRRIVWCREASARRWRARRYGRRRGPRRSACDGRRHRRRAGGRLLHVPDQVGRWSRRRIARVGPGRRSLDRPAPGGCRRDRRRSRGQRDGPRLVNRHLLIRGFSAASLGRS